MDDLALYWRSRFVIMLVGPNTKRTLHRWTDESPVPALARLHLKRGGNFSVRTGLEPNNLVVLDLDVTSRANGVHSLLEFMKEEGADFDVFDDVAQLAEDTRAPCVKSPHGYHLYFSGRSRCHTDILPGVDIKGRGGMIIIPPSKIDGVVYKWLNVESLAMMRRPLPEFPHWLTLLIACRGSRDAGPIIASKASSGDSRWLTIKTALLNRLDFPLRGEFRGEYRFVPVSQWSCPVCERMHRRDNLFLVYRFANDADGSVTVALRCFKSPSVDAFTFCIDKEQMSGCASPTALRKTDGKGSAG